MTADGLPPEAHSHFVDPYHQGSCEHATHVAESQWTEEDSPLDELGELCLELIVDSSGQIVEAWFDGDGSPWMLASASMLVESIENQMLDEVLDWSAAQHSDLCEFEVEPVLAIWRAPWDLLCRSLEADVDEEESDEEDSVFRGPHLGEEC